MAINLRLWGERSLVVDPMGLLVEPAVRKWQKLHLIDLQAEQELLAAITIH